MHSFPGDWPTQRIAVNRLIPEPSTDFSLDALPESLVASIKDMGILTPLTAVSVDATTYQVVGGHRRLKAAQQLDFKDVPVRLATGKLDPLTRVLLQLRDNRYHRKYSDIEIGRVLCRLKNTGMTEPDMIQQALPLLGQQASKRKLEDFLSCARFTDNLQKILHDLNCPLRHCSLIFHWSNTDREVLCNLLHRLRPGANKCRDLFELSEEAAELEGLPVTDLLTRKELQSIFEVPSQSTGDHYQAVIRQLSQWRYPTLTELRTRVRGALKTMRLDGKVRLRIPENFESDKIHLEFTFRTQAEFLEKTEHLVRISDSDSLRDLVDQIRGLKNKKTAQ